MINVAICDDNVMTTGEMENILYEVTSKKNIKIDSEVFWRGESLIKHIEEGKYFDLIFLDIEMGAENGITIARKIRKLDKNVLIVYVTGYESYMQESFLVRPFRFLMKPLNKEKIDMCFWEAYDEIISNDYYFRYSYQRVNYKISIKDILYFESRRRKLYIVTAKEIFEFYGKLNEIEQILKSSNMFFLRVHQSFLVNYKHIYKIAYNFVIVDNETKIPISEDRRKLISEQYCSMEDTFYVGSK